eukprot:CAMPEP_0174754158 /NCGR_PEP_ID=MMETSP1094-20130205/105486_1 /TAXON_ID=156173 /ORGANISM="Chrysochromulina brevifilum, Strain UTEX LB 985" /LENGTH=40 /DNA_ID= /DNA_START= /DNA_END= /DNA_ORIENTATION=
MVDEAMRTRALSLQAVWLHVVVRLPAKRAMEEEKSATSAP